MMVLVVGHAPPGSCSSVMSIGNIATERLAYVWLAVDAMVVV